MKKYQDALLANVKEQLEQWLDQPQAAVGRKDIHRFLHTVRGTSGTIGLTALSETARQLMEELERYKEETLPGEDVRRLLMPIAAEASGAFETAGGAEASTTEALRDFANRVDQPVVLVLDDDATFLVYVKDELESRGFMVLAATTPAQAFDYLHDYEPDCLVLDLMMKLGSGFDMILALREKLRQRFIPTTIVSADDRTATRIQAYRLGADDFLRKPLELPEFLAVLERQLERKRLFDRMRTHDETTGALKRSYAADSYNEVRQNASADGTPFSLALLDVDRLRRVNERFGPQAGDLVLAALVEHLRDTLQQAHTIVRYGGGTFLLLLPGSGERHARTELELAMQAFAALEFEAPDGAAFRASWSAGVVEPDDSGKSFPFWLDQAGKALRSAKDAGGCAVAASRGLRDTGLTAGMRQVRLAIVDDDPIVRSMLTEYAGRCFPDGVKLDVRDYRDGESFLGDDWSRSDDRYFVILDRMMPRMDGLEVLQHIRRLGRSDQYTVLMLTGKKGEADVVKALQLGADDYMTKPFSVKELEARIRRLARGVG